MPDFLTSIFISIKTNHISKNEARIDHSFLSDIITTEKKREKNIDAITAKAIILNIRSTNNFLSCRDLQIIPFYICTTH